jgi:hypothetical protein
VSLPAGRPPLVEKRMVARARGGRTGELLLALARSVEWQKESMDVFIRNKKYLSSWVVQGECTYVTVQEHILL